MDECEVCQTCRATLTVLVTPPDGTLEVCKGCMDSTGRSEGWSEVGGDPCGYGEANPE